MQLLSQKKLYNTISISITKFNIYYPKGMKIQQTVSFNTQKIDNMVKDLNQSYYNGTLWLNNQKWISSIFQTTFKSLKEIKTKGLSFVNMEESSFKIFKTLEGISFPKLEILDLKSNKIISIENIAYLDIPNLKMLILTDNNITVLKSLRKLHAPQLHTIHLEKNDIVDFSGLEELECPKLKRLVLDRNYQWQYQRQKDTLLKLNTNLIVKIEPKQEACFYLVPNSQIKNIQLKIRAMLRKKYVKLPNKTKTIPYQLVMG